MLTSPEIIAVFHGLLLGVILRGYAALLDTNEVLNYYLWEKTQVWPNWLRYVCKPIFLCPTCMSSVWGIAWIACFTPVPWVYLPLLSLTAAAVAYYNR